MIISLDSLRMHIKKSISNYYNRCKIKQKIITRCFIILKNKVVLLFKSPLHLIEQKKTEKWSLPSHTEPSKAMPRHPKPISMRLCFDIRR